MPRPDFTTVDAYIAAQPDAVQPILTRIRAAIRKAVPSAEERISYKIPTYQLPGGPVLYFAGWKQHYSLYPAGPRLIETFGEELAAYEVHKGTIRFPWSQPVPVKLIGRIAKFRAREITERAKAKLKKPESPNS